MTIPGILHMNLINELQVSAESDDVLTVLRKAKRLASKLGREDINTWLAAEQNGYTPGQEVPSYRKLFISFAYNTNGYIPAGYGYMKNGIEDLPPIGFSGPLAYGEPISNILTAISALSEGRNEMYYPVAAGSEESRAIRECYRFDPMFARQISFLLKLNPIQIKAIPEQVKDKVLDWALALESAGVHGDGMSFSAQEKEISSNVTFNIYESHIEQLNSHGKNVRGA
jgi:hypothetical protein